MAPAIVSNPFPFGLTSSKIMDLAQGYTDSYIDDIIEIITWEPPEDPFVITEEFIESLTETE